MEIISNATSFGGSQYVCRHPALNTEMTFAVFQPPGKGPFPVLWYLSGLTCSHANVMEKGEYRRLSADLGLMIVCPDTSPRGEHVVTHDDDWQLGGGAGFYVDATQEPYDAHYQMYTYVTEDLPATISECFPADMSRQGIFGHSMGGHGAMICALRNQETYKSCSALAPIVNPCSSEWSRNAFGVYLGNKEDTWRSYDAVHLIEDGASFPEILIDQGTADTFLENGLRPWLIESATAGTETKIILRMQEGYDHSYYFISTFMDDHLRWHSERLN